MEYIVQPYTQTAEGFRANISRGLFMLAAVLGCEPNRPSPVREHYVGRAAVRVDAPDEKEALTNTFRMFQNIDDSRLTPDAGSSMSSGDLVFVHTTGKWWLCCSFGWESIGPPPWA